MAIPTPDEAVFVPRGNPAPLAECQFYHRMELPGIGLVGGDWDLRSCVDDYLGRQDFRGKRTLDVGAASGYLSFAMEARGADVVSFDLASGGGWDFVPHYKRTDLAERRALGEYGTIARTNAYWTAHRALGSRARAFHGDIYALPDALGGFDTAFFGLVLNHLRDPFQALHSALRLTSGTAILTGAFPDNDRPVARFTPSAASPEKILSWWQLSTGCVREMLGVLGFAVVETHPVKALCLVPDNDYRPLQAIVARRV